MYHCILCCCADRGASLVLSAHSGYDTMFWVWDVLHPHCHTNGAGPCRTARFQLRWDRSPITPGHQLSLRTRLSVMYAWPEAKKCSFKQTTDFCTVIPWTLCTVTAHANCRGNCCLKMLYDAPGMSIFCLKRGTGRRSDGLVIFLG